jgi:hypothetical protein
MCLIFMAFHYRNAKLMVTRPIVSKKVFNIFSSIDNNKTYCQYRQRGIQILNKFNHLLTQWLCY